MLKASTWRPLEWVWDNEHLTIKTKPAVYYTIELFKLLYGVESWSVYRFKSHRLSAYRMCQLRNILKIRWWNHVSISNTWACPQCMTLNTEIESDQTYLQTKIKMTTDYEHRYFPLNERQNSKQRSSKAAALEGTSQEEPPEPRHKDQ